MKEQLTEHVSRDEHGLFWWSYPNGREAEGYEVSGYIEAELAHALREERKRSARYRVTLEQYADKTNWLTSAGDADYPRDLWQGPDDDGYDLARQALRQEDGEAGENA